MLILPNGKRLSDEAVFVAIDEYARNSGSVFDLYDEPSGGVHDEVLPIDILAPNALNAWGRGQPMSGMSEAWKRREHIAAVVRRISSTPIEDLADSHLHEQAARVASAIELILKIPYYGWTTATKLLHRLRPNLAPIWDSRVGEWYDDGEGWAPWVQRIYGQVREPGTLSCLMAARERLQRPLTLLRVWDILLWQLSHLAHEPPG